LIGVHPQLDGEVRSVLNVDSAISSRKTFGATGHQALAKQLKDATASQKIISSKISSQIQSFSEMMG